MDLTYGHCNVTCQRHRVPSCHTSHCRDLNTTYLKGLSHEIEFKCLVKNKLFQTELRPLLVFKLLGWISNELSSFSVPGYWKSHICWSFLLKFYAALSCFQLVYWPSSWFLLVRCFSSNFYFKIENIFLRHSKCEVPVHINQYECRRDVLIF